jgi:hypothetical protein
MYVFVYIVHVCVFSSCSIHVYVFVVVFQSV